MSQGHGQSVSPSSLTNDQIDQVVALARKDSPYLHVTTWALNRSVCTQARTSFTFAAVHGEVPGVVEPRPYSQSRPHKHVEKVEVCFEDDKGPVAKCASN